MHTLQPISALRSPNTLFKPRLVVTHGREVAAQFEWIESDQAHQFADDLAVNTASAVCIYEVDWRLPLPPPAGTVVDPDDYDWVQVS